MFYNTDILVNRAGYPAVPEGEGPRVYGIVVLTPAEAKRLLGKAVAALPEVKAALTTGRLIIANGTTNAFVAEELLGHSVPKYYFGAGVITDGLLTETRRDQRLKPYLSRYGQAVEGMALNDFVKEFEAHDILIKGANAVDPAGYAGVLLADEQGGTMAVALGVISARGARLLMPVGLEKLIPSVLVAATQCGQLRQKYVTGNLVGLMPVVQGEVITEVEALRILTGVKATLVAAGGVGGSEGAVVLALEGSEAAVTAAYDLVQSIKGEAPVPTGDYRLRPRRGG